MAKKKPESNGLFRNFVGAIILFVAFLTVLSLYSNPASDTEEVGLNVIAEYVKKGEVEEIVVSEATNVKVKLLSQGENEAPIESYKESSETIQTLLLGYGVTPEELQSTNIRVEGASGWKIFLVNVLPVLFPALLIFLFLWFMFRQVQGSNNKAMMFGQSSAKAVEHDGKKKRTTFKDVAGATEAKEELEEVVDFLRHPKKYTSIGARIPSGVLLMGPPGIGKTLLARAVAGEANVPFFHISGSEFVEMFVGVGASRVRDFFKKAKKAAPAILFIDEIDAVGRQRGTGMGGSHDEREQTLNQILTEMDGFEEDENVIVIAATNRPDVLDPALLRPGRFDRRVVLSLPDIRDREAILKVHARNKQLEDEVDLRVLAQRTTGFSGADLMNLLNEAAIFAARNNMKKVNMEHCLESIDKVLLGPQRKSARMSDKEKEITAYHEGGHALVAHLLPDSDPVHKISIIPRGHAGGFTLKLPDEDKKLNSRAEMLADIAVALGGHAAEIRIFGDLTTGPSSDLQTATKIARAMVMQYGMTDKLGARTFGKSGEHIFLGKEMHEARDYSEEKAQDIDGEIDRIIQEQYAIVEKLLDENPDKLKLIAETLLEVETIEREDFEKLFEDPSTKDEVVEHIQKGDQDTSADSEKEDDSQTDN